MMTEREGFVAMFKFLEQHWERNGRPDELGALLGSMAMLEDDLPADAGIWGDWLDAVKAAQAPQDSENATR